MMFYNTAARHLAQKMRIKKGKFSIERFADGEIRVRINENIKNKKVWVLASTVPPADNLLELALLLDTLKGARINLLIPYFAYARQDKKEGVAFSPAVISRMLKGVESIKVLDIHTSLKKILRYDNLLPHKLFHPIARKFDLIVSPDKGALKHARKLSSALGLPLICMDKVRPSKDKVRIVKVSGKLEGKKVLIVDDMISTGSTMIEASRKLKGAEVSVMATHGIFAGDALKKLANSPIKNIYVTNSLPQKPSRKLKVLNIAPYLESIMR